MTNKEIMEIYVSAGTQSTYISNMDILMALRDEPSSIMSEEDYEEYKKLPETLTVYRGCDKEEIDEVDGLPVGISWTLDYKVAEFFAYRYGNTDGCIVKAIVNKSDVRFYTNNRCEQEVMLFPSRLLDVEIVSEGQEEYDITAFHKYIEEKYGSY